MLCVCIRDIVFPCNVQVMLLFSGCTCRLDILHMCTLMHDFNIHITQMWLIQCTWWV